MQILMWKSYSSMQAKAQSSISTPPLLPSSSWPALTSRNDPSAVAHLLNTQLLFALPKNKKKRKDGWCLRPFKLYSCSLQHPLIASSKKSLHMANSSLSEPKSMRLLFVEMGVGYDQHGQDITSAAVKACKNAITSNSIPAFRTGAIPGVNWQQMKLKVKLGVPHCTQSALDIEKVKAVFPYGEIIDVEVVDGGLICSSGVSLEAMGDKNDDCYVVNAAVYVGY